MNLDMLQMVGLISMGLLLLVGAFVYYYYKQVKSASDKKGFSNTPINLNFSAGGDLSDHTSLNQDVERMGLLQRCQPNLTNNF